MEGKFESYSLLIIGSRKIHRNFDTVEELREELSKHFTKREIAGGIVRQLTTFTGKPNKDGYIETSWRTFSVCAYPFED